MPHSVARPRVSAGHGLTHATGILVTLVTLAFVPTAQAQDAGAALGSLQLTGVALEITKTERVGAGPANLVPRPGEPRTPATYPLAAASTA